MNNFAEFMSGWGWVLFSLIAAIFSAVMFLTNQYLKQPGHMLVFWLRVAVVLVLTPVMLHLPFPNDYRFYLAVAGTVLVGTFSDIRSFNVSAKYGGGVTSRVQPLIVWGSFFLWFLFDPQLISKYIDHPFNTAGVLLALGGCVWFSQRLNKCSITKSAMVEMTPALIGYAFTTVLNKYAMDHGHADGAMHGAVFAYMYVQSVIAVIILGPYVMFREKQLGVKAQFWRTRGMVIATLLMTFGWVSHMIFKNYAMAYTANPSYQAALNLTAPVFIAIFYYFKNHKEDADVKSGMGIVLCAVVLALMTVR